MSRSRLFRNAAGQEVLGITKAIYNQQSCAVSAAARSWMAKSR